MNMNIQKTVNYYVFTFIQSSINQIKANSNNLQATLLHLSPFKVALIFLLDLFQRILKIPSWVKIWTLVANTCMKMIFLAPWTTLWLFEH